MSKNYNWVSFIKKNNKLSIYLSKYLGWKEMSANELALQKVKLNFREKTSASGTDVLVASILPRSRYNPPVESKGFNFNQIGHSWCQTIGN